MLNTVKIYSKVKGGKVMTSNDVREVIYEALVMYIDEMSMIGKVNILQKLKDMPENSALEVTLKNGNTYCLIITPKPE